ncbi:MAG TPA: hypothetical protein VGP64_05095 [Polyangia bacterium]
MTRPGEARKWLGKLGVVGIVSAAMVMIPMFEHPAAAQQTWEPPAQQQWSAPAQGAPVYAPRPPVDTARAVMEATQDAQADNNAVLWFFAGCLLGLIGVIIAAVADPSPPAARMMGKSPEYLAVYTNTYRSVGHSAQLHSALWGLGTVVILYVVLIIIIVHDANTASQGSYFILRQ